MIHEYFMDGTKYACKRHYKREYLDYEKHLMKIKSPLAGLCFYCAREHEPLTPLPKVFPVISLRMLKEEVHFALGMRPDESAKMDEGLRVMPDGHIRWTFPRFFPLRKDQMIALENVAKPAKYLTKLGQDWRSNRWTVEIFRKSIEQRSVRK